MSDASVTLVLEFEGEADPTLAQQAKAATGAETRTVEQHGLEGDLNTWLMIGNFAIASLVALIPVVSTALQARRAKSIKVGDVTIENPTAEQVTELLRRGRG